MKDIKLKRDFIKQLVESTNGQIFKIRAKRKEPKMVDGVMSYEMEMDCRTGVRKYLKGGESTIKNKDGLIGVYVVSGRNGGGESGAYRCFAAENVLSISFNKKVYTFSE